MHGHARGKRRENIIFFMSVSLKAVLLRIGRVVRELSSRYHVLGPVSAASQASGLGLGEESLFLSVRICLRLQL